MLREIRRLQAGLTTHRNMGSQELISQDLERSTSHPISSILEPTGFLAKSKINTQHTVIGWEFCLFANHHAIDCETLEGERLRHRSALAFITFASANQASPAGIRARSAGVATYRARARSEISHGLAEADKRRQNTDGNFRGSTDNSETLKDVLRGFRLDRRPIRSPYDIPKGGHEISCVNGPASASYMYLLINTTYLHKYRNDSKYDQAEALK